MHGETMTASTGQQNPYLVQKVMTAGPEQLIAYVYDAGISACARQDKVKGLEAVQELINALNFDDRTTAGNFFRMYSFILELIRGGRYTQAKGILSELRQAWTTAFKLN